MVGVADGVLVATGVADGVGDGGCGVGVLMSHVITPFVWSQMIGSACTGWAWEIRTPTTKPTNIRRFIESPRFCNQ
jgi:hypothetical protein